jgi:hypothetical protein
LEGEESPVTEYVTKDSGERASYESGMIRDTQAGKARFDLFIADGVPYKDQLFTRIAELMTRGIEKYGERNWELAGSDEEIARFRASAFRHFMQWFCGELDEDHAAAVIFNLLAAETTEFKMKRSKASLRIVNDKPSDDAIIEWILKNPREFEKWVVRQNRIRGGRVFGR